MTDEAAYKANAEKLATQVVEDIQKLHEIFPPSIGGMIRMMIVLHYLKEAMPGVFSRIDDCIAISGTWMALGCPGDGSDINSKEVEDLLRAFEGEPQ